jgi:hypothetical protein
MTNTPYQAAARSSRLTSLSTLAQAVLYWPPSPSGSSSPPQSRAASDGRARRTFSESATARAAGAVPSFDRGVGRRFQPWRERRVLERRFRRCGSPWLPPQEWPGCARPDGENKRYHLKMERGPSQSDGRTEHVCAVCAQAGCSVKSRSAPPPRPQPSGGTPLVFGF